MFYFKEQIEKQITEINVGKTILETDSEKSLLSFSIVTKQTTENLAFDAVFFFFQI